MIKILGKEFRQDRFVEIQIISFQIPIKTKTKTKHRYCLKVQSSSNIEQHFGKAD